MLIGYQPWQKKAVTSGLVLTQDYIKLTKFLKISICYNNANSELPGNHISAMATDGNGNKWIGIEFESAPFNNSCLVKFDGTNFTVYDSSNSGLPHNCLINCISIDGNGIIWIGTDWGVVKYDGTNWTVYNEYNSGLPGEGVYSITIDENGNKWLGTEVGIAVFKDEGVVAVKDNRSPVTKLQNKISLTVKNFSILFKLQTSSNIKLQNYSMNGRLLSTLVDSYRQAGSYKINWDSKRFGSGIYFLKLSANGSAVSKKFTIIKQKY